MLVAMPATKILALPHDKKYTYVNEKHELENDEGGEGGDREGCPSVVKRKKSRPTNSRHHVKQPETNKFRRSPNATCTQYIRIRIRIKMNQCSSLRSTERKHSSRSSNEGANGVEVDEEVAPHLPNRTNLESRRNRGSEEIEEVLRECDEKKKIIAVRLAIDSSKTCIQW